MNIWQESVLFDLINAEKASHSFNVILLAVNELRFEYCTYGISVFRNGSNEVSAFGNYPDKWKKCYFEAGHFAVDPMVIHGYQFEDPCLWAEKAFESVSQLWDEANSFGLKIGWSKSNHSTLGITGLLSFVSSMDIITNAELREKEDTICWITEMIHFTICNLQKPPNTNQSLAVLTPREVEMLKWATDGKSLQDIAKILNISTSTVNFHIKNIIAKLNVPNKLAAIVVAL